MLSASFHTSNQEEEEKKQYKEQQEKKESLQGSFIQDINEKKIAITL